MSDHGANPIFFNKKSKDWTSRTLGNPPPPTSDNISFLPYPPPHLKVDVIYVSPLKAVFHSIKIFARADFLELKIPRGKI